MRVIGLLVLTGLEACSAFTLSASQIAPYARAPSSPLLRCPGVSLQEQAPIPETEPAPTASDASPVSTEQLDLVERASDPFRVIRVVLYVTFGVSGIAGCGIAVSQMGKDPVTAMSNLAVNGAVLAGGVGLFLFDRSVTAKLREKAEQELKNPYLKGDAVLQSKEDE